jgi:hypothetical protein
LSRVSGESLNLGGYAGPWHQDEGKVVSIDFAPPRGGVLWFPVALAGQSASLPKTCRNFSTFP